MTPRAVTVSTMVLLAAAMILALWLAPATPQVTKEVVMTDTGQTLSNKTLIAPIIATILNTGTLTLPTATDTMVARATTDTLSNKSLNLSSNTLSGTLTQFNTALSDDNFVSLTGTETLTNKTLTSPSMSNPTITGTAVMAAASLTGALSSTKTCVTGYTRLSPNYCAKNDVTATSWTDGVACTSRVIGSGGLAVGTKVHLRVVWQGLSNNATGSRTNDVTLFSDVGCATPRSTSNYTLREFAAVSAGTVIGQTESIVVADILNAVDTVYATQTNAGGNGNADILNATIVGYFD